MLRMSLSNMSSIIKQQPRSPVSFESFPANFYNRHRQSTASLENEQLSPASNNNAESSSTSTLVPPSATDDGRGEGRGGWYEKRKTIQVFGISIIYLFED
jgi:hypothetical protein